MDQCGAIAAGQPALGTEGFRVDGMRPGDSTLEPLLRELSFTEERIKLTEFTRLLQQHWENCRDLLMNLAGVDVTAHGKDPLGEKWHSLQVVSESVWTLFCKAVDETIYTGRQDAAEYHRIASSLNTVRERFAVVDASTDKLSQIVNDHDIAEWFEVIVAGTRDILQQMADIIEETTAGM